MVYLHFTLENIKDSRGEPTQGSPLLYLFFFISRVIDTNSNTLIL